MATVGWGNSFHYKITTEGTNCVDGCGYCLRIRQITLKANNATLYFQHLWSDSNNFCTLSLTLTNNWHFTSSRHVSTLTMKRKLERYK